jgi:hypothetical protein
LAEVRGLLEGNGGVGVDGADGEGKVVEAPAEGNDGVTLEQFITGLHEALRRLGWGNGEGAAAPRGPEAGGMALLEQLPLPGRAVLLPLLRGWLRQPVATPVPPSQPTPAGDGARGQSPASEGRARADAVDLVFAALDQNEAPALPDGELPAYPTGASGTPPGGEGWRRPAAWAALATGTTLLAAAYAFGGASRRGLGRPADGDRLPIRARRLSPPRRG